MASPNGRTAGASRIAISDIVIGERRRVDMGDIDELATSIARYGLIHPIVIDDEARLIAGERRLHACQQLGWTEIDIRNLGSLTDSERREIELEENLRRKDLTEYERSRTLTQRAEVAAEILQGEFRPDSGRNSRGRPKEPASTRAIAERIGVPDSTIAEAQAHVATADAFPFMQSWKQYHVLEAREALSVVPEDEQPKVAAIIGQPGVPAADAIRVIHSLASKPSPERERIYALAESTDSRDRSAALTQAAAMPVMPDPRLVLLDDARRLLRKAARMFPEDPANPSIMAILPPFEAAYAAIKDFPRA